MNFLCPEENIKCVENFIKNLPINNIQKSFNYLEFIKNINKCDQIKINIERFSNLNECVEKIIKKELIDFNANFMKKYLHLIEYDYLTCSNIKNIISARLETNLKLNNLSAKYIVEFYMYFMKLLKNECYDELNSEITNLKENTIDFRNEINLKIQNNLKAIDELENIKITTMTEDLVSDY